MAQRDRTQGFGFMYVNVPKLLEENRKLTQKENESPVVTTNVHHANFQKEMPQPVSKEAQVKQIKQNLDRLQSLHHKLHAMLDELNQVTNKEKPEKPE